MIAKPLKPSAAATVFQIEDEPLMATLVGKMICEWPELRYVGFSTSGIDGLEACRAKTPTIVLLDLGLGDSNGFSIVGKLNELPCPPRILLFTGHADELTLFRLCSAKVAGLVWKTGVFDEHLRTALRVVAGGGTYFTDDLKAVIRRFCGSPDAFFKILSPTEQSLLPHFGRGLSDEEIAVETGRKPQTVKWHRRRILARLGLHHTTKLMLWAREKGFVCDLLPAPPCVA